MTLFFTIPSYQVTWSDLDEVVPKEYRDKHRTDEMRHRELTVVVMMMIQIKMITTMMIRNMRKRLLMIPRRRRRNT